MFLQSLYPIDSEHYRDFNYRSVFRDKFIIDFYLEINCDNYLRNKFRKKLIDEKPFPAIKAQLGVLVIVAEGTTDAAQRSPKAIRSTQQLAEPLPALSGQADPIRSFQYVYNPLIARFSWHNLKLFLGVIRDARFPASSTATSPPPRLSPQVLLLVA